MSTASDDKATKDNKRIPLYFVAAFVVVAAVNAVMVTLALKTHSGTVSDKAYQQGVEYNQTIAAAEAAAKLGWQGRLTYQDGRVELQLKDKDGSPVVPKKVILTAYRPSQSGKDFTVAMQPVQQKSTQRVGELTEQGEARSVGFGEDSPTGTIYRTAVNFPLSGLWELRVQADQFQLKQRIEVKENKNLTQRVGELTEQGEARSVGFGENSPTGAKR